MEKMSTGLREKDREVYLDGIKKYMHRGVPVLIDGEEAGENGLRQLFSPPEGTFYMADYVIEELPQEVRDKESRQNPARMLREEPAGEGAYLPLGGLERYILKEIRFDQAYHS